MKYINNKSTVESLSLLEVLVKTAYQTQITHPTDRQCEKPSAYGSGFIVEYNADKFFVTADHTLHLDDYNDEIEERTGVDYTISIFNNVTPRENVLSTVITPLGGFYYMEALNLNKPEQVVDLVDIAVCRMKHLNFQYPFLTDEVVFSSETIKAGELKFHIRHECFGEPNIDEQYFIFGKIRTDIVDDIRLHRESTLKENLRFVKRTGDYLLLNTIDTIADENDWSGLSGSPVIGESGICIGVLSSVCQNSCSVWVVPISKVKMLIEVAVQEEKLEQAKQQNSSQ